MENVLSDATNCADVIDDTSLQDVSTDSTTHRSTPRDSDDRQFVGDSTSDEQIGAAYQLPMSEQECTSNNDGQPHHSNENLSTTPGLIPYRTQTSL